jgi:hypothetical protein
MMGTKTDCRKNAAWRGDVKDRMSMSDQTDAAPPPEPLRGDLPPAALRALREAEARRAAAQLADEAPKALEKGGRGGAEPVRYGDWEVKGIASDF